VPEVSKVIEELDYLSDQISTQVRTIAIGLLAITWATLVADSGFLRKLSQESGRALLIVGTLSVFILVIDFLQYAVAYIHVEGALKRAEQNEEEEVTYDTGSLMRRLRFFFFWTKQFALVGTIAYFLFFFVVYITHLSELPRLPIKPL
jgi:hypothetical protein